VNTNHYIDNKNSLSILFSYVDLKAFIPSSVDYDTYLKNPKSAAFTWKAARGFEDSKRGILGLSWNHKYHDNLEQVTSVFSSFRDAYEPRPFNILDENTITLGLRTRFIGRTSFFDKDLKWTLGLEGFGDQYKSKTFENLYESFPPGHGSEKGDILSDFKQNRSYFNLFFESNYKASKRTEVSIGVNYNQTQYQLDDNYPESESNPNQSGSFKFKGIVSPKVGVTYKLSSLVNLYANMSHGFSPVTLEETLLPDGQINTSLKPETGWNFEIGTKGTVFNNRLVFNASVFRLAIKNLLVARRISDDQFVGINAGNTQHDGLELEFDYKWIEHESIVLSQFVSYTLNDFIFKDFIDGSNNYSGNDLTGVPDQIFNTGVDYSHSNGVFGNVNFQYVGSIPITDSNSLYSDSYKLVNSKVGYKKEIFKKFNFSVFLGLNNIFNEKYASQILINASSFGGSAPRYYYPGNPFNFFSGFNLKYTFK
jgi:iron complex outermembrane receptor protein